MQPSDSSNNELVNVPNTNVVPPQPILTQPTSETEEEQEDKLLNPLLIVLGVCAVILILAIVWLLTLGRQNSTVQNVTGKLGNIISGPTATPTPVPRAQVSGVVQFEGYAPAGSYIAIAEKDPGETDFKDVVSGIVPTNGNIQWDWSEAGNGKNYEIKATLKMSGKVINQSSIVSVSAPADTIILPLTSTQQPPLPVTSAINGNIHIDGYIPSSSYINITARNSTTNNSTPAVSNLSPIDNTSWSWSNATLGQTYQMQANLVSSTGSIISSSAIQSLTAPSSNVLFYISSTANPPTPTVTGLSGTININGNIPSNSYITLATRPTGTSTFNQVASNISSTDGVGWSWNSANSGQQYDVQAYLWSNGNPYSSSNIVTVAAPSTNILLTINAQQQLSQPSASSLNISCGSNQNGTWQATINYNTQSNLPSPAGFNIIVNLASGGNQVVNTTLYPSNPNSPQSLTTGYVFTNAATYYVQYAYNNSVSSSNFSPLSPPVQFSCQ